MEYHHETQPMPNPLSWFFHHLPRPLHRLEVVGNFVAQLVLPFGLFLPQPIASAAALLMIGTQLYLVVSGNYAWLNWVTIVAIVAAIADPIGPSAGFAPAPPWFSAVVLALTVVIVVLSWWPVRNMAGPRQAMNASFNPFRLVNTYGAFGSVSRERIELVIEGTDADDPRADTAATWREYGFRGKPDDPTRLPPQVAPYHLRLDWLLWFIPLSPAYGGAWFVRFIARLLEGDRATLRLLRRNPFEDGPPRFVRARFFRYRYSSWRERRELGAWWIRQYEADYLPPVNLDDLRRAGA
jgi:membrane protein implicated in regulation of membrane protease activity